jgi:hypothetical protein
MYVIPDVMSDSIRRYQLFFFSKVFSWSDMYLPILGLIRLLNKERTDDIWVGHRKIYSDTPKALKNKVVFDNPVPLFY